MNDHEKEMYENLVKENIELRKDLNREQDKVDALTNELQIKQDFLDKYVSLVLKLTEKLMDEL